ncbi:MAG: alanyl-tRNA editing protein [Lachnospiraceae bacterium]|nr:alanyl-tRNA editing protein [Lachnospiraceae bacterium]
MKKNIDLDKLTNTTFLSSPQTEKVYDYSAYDPFNEAKLLHIIPIEDDLYLLFDSTIFFPEEGGQTCDKGKISFNLEGQSHILDIIDVHLQKIDKKEYIFHRIKGNDSEDILNEAISKGIIFSMEIDFDYRYSNMQNHTGEHIFSGIVKKEFGYDNVGFHLSDNSVTMDYNGPLTDSDVARIEEEVNYVIAQNFPVYCSYPGKDELIDLDYRSKIEIDGPIRIVEIPGVDTCACCAPHVYSTCEVGHLIVLSSTSYKGGTRLSILCGDRANKYIKDNQNMLFALSHTLKLPFEDLQGAVEKMQKEIYDLKIDISNMQSDMLKMKLKSLPATGNICICVKDTDSKVKRDCINELKLNRDGYIMILDSKENSRSYVLGSRDKNCNDFLKEISDRLIIKGGGKPEMIQGSIESDNETIINVLKQNNFTII